MGFLGWISVSLTPSTFSIWDSAVKRSCLFLPIYSLISIPYLYQYSPLIFVRFFGGINHHSYYIFRCWTCPSFGFWKPNLLLLSLSLSLNCELISSSVVLMYLGLFLFTWLRTSFTSLCSPFCRLSCVLETHTTSGSHLRKEETGVHVLGKPLFCGCCLPHAGSAGRKLRVCTRSQVQGWRCSCRAFPVSSSEHESESHSVMPDSLWILQARILEWVACPFSSRSSFRELFKMEAQSTPRPSR